MTVVYTDTTQPINPPQLAYELSTAVGETVHVFTAPPALADCLVDGATKTVYADDGGLLRRVLQESDHNAFYAVGYDATLEMQGQSFILSGTDDVADTVDIYVYSRTGAPADSILVEMLSGSMSGAVIGTSATILASALTTSAWNTFTFGSPVALSAATTYYIRISRTGANSAVNYISVAATGTNVYAGGSRFNRSGGVWTADTARDLNFRVNLEGNIDTSDLATAITAHTSSVTSAGESGDFGYRLFQDGNLTVKALLSLPNLRGYDMNLRSSGIHVDTAPVGSAITVNLYLFSGITNLVTLGTLTIADGTHDGTLTSFTGLSHWPQALWPNSYDLHASVTAVGSGTAGANLTWQVQAVAA